MSQSTPPLEWKFVDLISLLWQRRLIIVASIFLSIGLALVYLWQTQASYRSTAYFLPPDFADVDRLNQLDRILKRNKTDPTYTIESVYQLFKESLRSRSLLFDFFTQQEIYLLFDDSLTNKEAFDFDLKLKKAFDQFLSRVQVSNDRSDRNSLLVSIQFNLPASALETQTFLNRYIDMVESYLILRLIESEQRSKNLEINQLNNHIKALRSTAEFERLDQIARIDEAIAIASHLNIDVFSPRSENSGIDFTGVNQQGLTGMPLYFLGHKTLNSMKTMLEQRRSNDPFIKELRQLQSMINQLDELNTQPEQLASFKLDQPASLGDKTWPINRLVVAIAFIVGSILGGFFVLANYFIRLQRLSS